MDVTELEKMVAELAALDDQIAEARAVGRQSAIEQIKTLLAAHELSVDDIKAAMKKPRKKRGPNKKKADAAQGVLL